MENHSGLFCLFVTMSDIERGAYPVPSRECLFRSSVATTVTYTTVCDRGTEDTNRVQGRREVLSVGEEKRVGWSDPNHSANSFPPRDVRWKFEDSPHGPTVPRRGSSKHNVLSLLY